VIQTEGVRGLDGMLPWRTIVDAIVLSVGRMTSFVSSKAKQNLIKEKQRMIRAHQRCPLPELNILLNQQVLDLLAPHILPQRLHSSIPNRPW